MNDNRTPAADIYTQHDKHFQNVKAFVITRDGKSVGTVSIKYPKDGAGRLYAYVHVHGSPMVRGMAGGYGYSKADAAISNAAHLMELDSDYSNQPEWFNAVKMALLPDNGTSWDRHLADADFTDFQAV